MDALNPTVLASIVDPKDLIEGFGAIGVLLIVFLESCFLFFLPGDSLLFLAGFLASQGTINLPLVAIGAPLAAVAGNQVGYVFGRRVGPALFHRPDSRLFKQSNLEKTHGYFEKHGPKTIVLARFVPIVRTFACIVAGVGRMDYRVFLTYNIVGAVLWGAGITLIGWGVGRRLGEAVNVDKYILPIVALILVASFIPVIVEYIRHRRSVSRAVGSVNDTIQDEITVD